jgi:hypothetical protein
MVGSEELVVYQLLIKQSSSEKEGALKVRC